MGLLNDLEALGVDIADAGKRLNNNMSLYERLLKKFPGQAKMLPVLPKYEEGDFQGALESAHTMKGMTGNLSMTLLYNAYNEAVALMRSDDYPSAIEKVKSIMDVQQQIIDTIDKYQ